MTKENPFDIHIVIRAGIISDENKLGDLIVNGVDLKSRASRTG